LWTGLVRLATCAPQRLEDLQADQLVALELRQHIHHALDATLVELPDDGRRRNLRSAPGTDVRWRREHSEQVGAGARRETTKAANRVHESTTSPVVSVAERRMREGESDNTEEV
jgi:hypothetical protein